MTKQRIDSHSTEFGIWIRQQPEIDSRLGFVATNLDYVWRNYKTGNWLLIEEKRHGAYPKAWQAEIFALLDEGCSHLPNYHGFHVLRFEHTSPTDGKIWLDSIEITKDELIRFLQFKPATE